MFKIYSLDNDYSNWSDVPDEALLDHLQGKIVTNDELWFLARAELVKRGYEVSEEIPEMKECPGCTLEIPYKNSQCPRCGEKFKVYVQPPQNISEKREKDTSVKSSVKPQKKGDCGIRKKITDKKEAGKKQGMGCFVALMGLLFGALNPLVGFLLVVGGLIYTLGNLFGNHKFICSECGNTIESTTKICPTCKADLGWNSLD
jgi:rubrerythrin